MASHQRTNSYWNAKISALLHDTPDKAADIISHEFRAERFQKLFGLESTVFNKQADFAAAAADRLPFPAPGKAFVQNLAEIETLPHPLGGSSLTNATFKSTAEAEEKSQATMPYLLNNDDPRAAFIAAWRFWRNWASSADPRFAHLPADTRIPDHTIWNHLFITTAFQGSLPVGQKIGEATTPKNAPRLLLFSLGPVQPLIAAARSTRDLWSGSYLLSYLISKALGKIALELGPDHVIFPNLLDQPLLDLALKEDIYDKHGFSQNGNKENTLWKGLGYEKENLSKLLTPSLPNRFMALLPAVHPVTGESAKNYAANLAEDIKKSLDDIAQNVSSFLKDNNISALASENGFHPELIKTQLAKALEVHWQTLPVPSSVEDLDQLIEQLPGGKDHSSQKAIKAIREMLKQPACNPQYPLRPESNWAGLNALLSWLHDGVKSNRLFDAWSPGEWKSGMSQMKDALTGKEEAVLTITNQKTEEQVAALCSKIDLPKYTFKPGETLGALTLVKRLWWHTWLGNEKILGLSAGQLRERHPMPNTHAIALGQPFADSDDDEDVADRAKHDKYFAILAFDGDEMGKWISGEKSPNMKHCLSPKAKEFYQENASDFLKADRTLTPSWHAQFSEALGNFSFHCAQRIVEAFDGRLIYAGGDDVLAMLPAKDALPCARALRAAFRGEMDHLDGVNGVLTGSSKAKKSDRTTPLFALQEDGYLRLHKDSGAKHGDSAKLLSDPVDFPALLPGPAADASVGIAIAHFKAPLQDVVRAAQAAEKRAKNHHGRAAVAISLFKRSGEILEWGTKWSHSDKTEDSAGYRLLDALTTDLGERELNRRFPHKLEAFLTPYLPASKSIRTDEDFENVFPAILAKDVQHAFDRDKGGFETTTELFTEYWHELSAPPNDAKDKEPLPFSEKLQLLINLLRTASWAANKDEDQTTYAKTNS